jgi:zinc transporter ZupT
MEQGSQIAFATSLIAAAVTTSGIIAVRGFGTWARRNTTFFTCFAAGVLIAVSFFHIIPKSFATSAEAPIYLFGGYMRMYVFNRFLTAFVCGTSERRLVVSAHPSVPFRGQGLDRR